jgi:hypothetical protein
MLVSLTAAVLTKLAMSKVTKVHLNIFCYFFSQPKIPAGQHFVPGPACFSGRQHYSTVPRQAERTAWGEATYLRGSLLGLKASRSLSIPVLNSSAVTDGAAAGGVGDKWIARVLTAYDATYETTTLPYP